MDVGDGLLAQILGAREPANGQCLLHTYPIQKLKIDCGRWKVYAGLYLYLHVI